MEPVSLPSIEPDRPGHVGALVRIRSEGAALLFPPPEEERIVGMARTVHRDVPSEVAGERPSDVGQRIGHFEIWA